MLPSSAECWSKSTTLIAFPLFSSSFFLDPNPSPFLLRTLPTRLRVYWCIFRTIRTALPIGPCPCRFGRKDENIDFEFPLLLARAVSNVCWDGARRAVKVEMACLYALVAEAGV